MRVRFAPGEHPERLQPYNFFEEQKHRFRTGGKVTKTKTYRLLQGEIVISFHQSMGMTHGQIIRLISTHRAMDQKGTQQHDVNIPQSPTESERPLRVVEVDPQSTEGEHSDLGHT